MEEHIRTYFEAGMDACVTKPIDRAQLLLTINKVLDEEVHIAIEEETSPSRVFPDEREIGSGENELSDSVANFLGTLDQVSYDMEKKNNSH